MKELCICTSFIRRTPLLVAVAAGSALVMAPSSFGAGRTVPGNTTSNVGPHGQVKQIPGAPGVRTPAQKVVVELPKNNGGIQGVPANDACAAAMVIFDGATAFDNIGATTDGPAEGGCAFCCGDLQINQDIWYDYFATATDTVTVSLCGSGYDTKVALYTGCACPVAGAPLACNDDSCGLQSNITAAVTAGSCYKLRVGGFTGATGAGTISITYGGGGGNPACGAAATHDCFSTGTPGCTDEVCCNIVCALDSFCCAVAWDGICVSEAIANCDVVAPVNDNCPDRILIGVGDTPFTTIGATTDGPPTDACIDVAGDPQVNQDVWFNFFAPTTELYSATTCGSGYDTKLAVYTGCVCPVDPATVKACNDDSCGLQSVVTWDAIAGTCYKIRVGGFGAAAGSGTLHVMAGVPLGPCDDPNNHPCDQTGGPGCSDHDCCVIVCAIDPFCCDVSWDGICVNEAAQFCGPPCIVECPAGAVLEGEPCGSDTNGGCNSTPPVYTQIACGDNVCGDFWASGGTRDTDWYQFTIDQDQTTVNWSVRASFPAVAFLVNNDCGNIVVIVVGAGNCPVRAEASGCAALAAGTYVAFAATASFDGLPCGGKDNDYLGTLTCTLPCLTDINHDGTTNTGDLLQVINNWGPCD